MVGYSDLDRRFTGTLLAVGKSENTYVYDAIFRTLRSRGYRPMEVLGDGTAAISAAAKENFPWATRLMCFVHVFPRVDKHLAKVPAHFRKHMYEEVLLLQFARSHPQFQQSIFMSLPYPSLIKLI